MKGLQGEGSKIAQAYLRYGEHNFGSLDAAGFQGGPSIIFMRRRMLGSAFLNETIKIDAPEALGAGRFGASGVPDATVRQSLEVPE